MRYQFTLNKIYRAVFLMTILVSISLYSKSQTSDTLSVHWDKKSMVSKTTATLQVVVNPPLRRGEFLHDQAFAALKEIGCDYVRFVPWLPYPKLGVAELKPPTPEKTYWDFSLIDPLTLDFLDATKGHSVILNFSTIPQWMYKTDQPVTYPDNADSAVWSYEQGKIPRDTTYKEIADYYARLYSWYIKGGFKDEHGKYLQSNYHYNIPYIEILNEVDDEHGNTVQSYTKLYDAVVSAVKPVSPKTKFVALALEDPNRPDWFEYFLNPKNHKANVPVDLISYHFYALGSATQPVERMQYEFFSRADGFLNVVKFIESIRKRLSPSTKTTINEVGSILGDDSNGAAIPDVYWNISGALYAYLYLNLTQIGIDIVGESQLVGYPTQFPSVSMINWKTGQPNARYWVLKIIKDNFGPGDVLVNTETIGNSEYVAQGFSTKTGKKILLINKTNKTIDLNYPEITNKTRMIAVDTTTGDHSPAETRLSNPNIELKPFSVCIISL